MYYLIENTLKECKADEILNGISQYVAVLSPEEWAKDKDRFEMGIDIDSGDSAIRISSCLYSECADRSLKSCLL